MENIFQRPNILFVPNVNPENTYEERYWNLSYYARSIGKPFNAKYYPGYASLPIQNYMADIMNFIATNKHIAVEPNYMEDETLSKVLPLFSDVIIHIYEEPEDTENPDNDGGGQPAPEKQEPETVIE